MVPIRQYRDYWKAMLTRIPAMKRVILVTEESELSNVIKNISDEEIFTVVVVPSAKSRPGDTDNFGMMNTGIVFVLQKLERGSISPTNDTSDANDDLIDYLEVSQNVMKSVVDTLKADKDDQDHCTLMKKLDLNRITVEPEYNYFGSYGYSLSFYFETPGY